MKIAGDILFILSRLFMFLNRSLILLIGLLLTCACSKPAPDESNSYQQVFAINTQPGCVSAMASLYDTSRFAYQTDNEIRFMKGEVSISIAESNGRTIITSSGAPDHKDNVVQTIDNVADDVRKVCKLTIRG